LPKDFFYFIPLKGIILQRQKSGADVLLFFGLNRGGEEALYLCF